MNIILYSNNCPNCKLLKEYLDKHNVEYEIFSDVQKMIEKGFDRVPKLEINNEIYDFNEALVQIKNMVGERNEE